jgi:hypothetical protein
MAARLSLSGMTGLLGLQYIPTAIEREENATPIHDRRRFRRSGGDSSTDDGAGEEASQGVP